MAGGWRHAQVHCRGGGGFCSIVRDHLHTYEKQQHEDTSLTVSPFLKHRHKCGLSGSHFVVTHLCVEMLAMQAL